MLRAARRVAGQHVEAERPGDLVRLDTQEPRGDVGDRGMCDAQPGEPMRLLFDRFGVAFSSVQPGAEVVKLATRAEELGFDSVWLAEYYHHRSLPPLAALTGAATHRIKIGLGILPTHTRHPALIAMEAATLDELNGGRLIMGLGAARTTAADHAVAVGPITSLRESVTIVRRLLDGEEVTYRGKAWRIETTKLKVPTRRRLPIYVGTYPYSPQMLKVAGGLADGVVLVWCTPELVKRACELMAEGADGVGRSPSSVDVVAYLVLSVDDDPQQARAACRPLVASYTFRSGRWREVGLVTDEDVEPVLAAFDRGGFDAATAAVSDAYVDKIAIAGDVSYCRDRLKEYVGTGLRMPIAYQVLGPDPVRAMELIAREFLAPPPALGGGERPG